MSNMEEVGNVLGKIQGDHRKFLDHFKSYFGSQISSQSLNEVHIYQLPFLAGHKYHQQNHSDLNGSYEAKICNKKSVLSYSLVCLAPASFRGYDV